MRNQKRAAEAISTVILLIILCAYWVAILCINFSENPDFYCTDMYSDMLYAVEVWNQKTIFPDGWVFGNQLYAVATPVLAALCYGFVQNPCIAMGVASVLMGLGVIGSFSWMLRPVFANFRERLVATVCFMTVILASGDPVSSVTGWQLFFTMCSYYACYAITAFLAFGCYLRSSENWSFALWATFLAACVFSFGTGIQSLRQTAVMVLPLVALEVLRILYSKVVKKEYFYKSSLIAGTLSVCNLAGVLCTKFIAVEQNEIFGSVFLQIPPYLLGEILSCIKTPFSLFHFQNVTVILFLGLCISCLIAVFCRRDWVDDAALLCTLLCVISVAVIFAIDVFTTMSIREIYYFLLYPLTAICTAWVYSRLKEKRKTLVIIIVAVFSLTCGQKLLPYVPPREESEPIRQISDYLEEHEITTVYSHWNLGEQVAIVSDFRIQAGFWSSRRDPFNSVKYLCNPAVYNRDITDCAYLVRGEDVFDLTSEEAEKRGASIQLIQYCPELDIYLFTADVKLMQ